MIHARTLAALAGAVIASVAFGGSAVDARWIPLEIDLTECPSLDGYRSADLYLGFDADPGNPAITSDPGTGLAIKGGTFYQDSTGSNSPRPEGWFKVFPCARWDSYLTVGGTVPFFSPAYPEPDPADWGTELVAEWLASPGETPEVVVDPATFGDNRFYVRVGRFTGTPGTTAISGELGVVYFPFPDMPTVPVTDSVIVPNCAPCWASADLDGDGVVGASDLAQLIGAWGACGSPCPEDLDGDGVVGASDLAQLIGAWG
jgi:hypothetical protein